MSSLIDSVKSLSDLVHYSRRPLPSSPDGLTGSEAAPAVLGKPMDHGKLYDLIDDIQAAIKRGNPIDLDDGTVVAIIDALKHANTTGIDDRYLLLEKVFTLTSRLPPGSIIQSKITDAIVGLLYRDLPHPPGTYLGKKYAFRSADGSYNNINIPDLGKAKMPYTRSVQSRNPIPYSSLPDPDLLFDALLKRDGSRPHPSGISSLLFAFANLIIHSLFKTDEKNKNINNTSSYLDLSPLYGDSEAIQKTVRQCDGRGLLWEDCFADQRMLMMPPSTPALLIMFCRNHNFIARRLLQINERRTYTDPPPQNDPAALMTQDDDIFNRARLINCAHFTNVILSDYIGAILNLTKEGNTWNLNPLERIRELDHELIPRGEGNAVSVEFNLLYRWHATISIPDEEWTESLFRKMFPDKPIHSLTVADFQARVAQLRFGPSAAATTVNPTPQAQEISNSAHGTTGTDQSEAAVPHLPTVNGNWKSNGWTDGTTNATAPSKNAAAHTKHTSTSTTSTVVSDDDLTFAVPTLDPRQLNRSKSSASSSSAGAPSGPRTWTFGGLERDPVTGKYNDDKLADMLQNATETPAQAFRARGTPEVLRVVEVMAIEQARQWGVCTMNEFRQFIGLKAYDDFEEWNPDPEIANCARALYGHIDNLELYVGMQAEQTKVPGLGAGLCPGYTISRAILGDAVALTRGDRFLTTDMTPYNLTAWGYQDCAHDTRNGAFGSGLSKILLRNLPGNYSYNSVYGLFAFYTPKTMVSVLSNLRVKELYDFVRPGSEQEITTVNSYAGVTQVLFDYQSFKVTYERTMKRLTNGYGFFLAFDEPAKHLKDLKLMREALFPTPHTMSEYGAFYRATTARLIETKSFSLVGKGTRSLDIVRDVFNLVPVHWISKQVAGIPLKTKETPQGIHTEQEVYGFMALCFTYIFLNVQPETGWILEENSEKVAKLLQGYVKGHIDAIRSKKISFSKLKDSFLTWFTGEKDESREFLKRLAASNRPSDELSYNVFGIIVASCANFSMAASLILNFYLDDARKAEREEIIKLVKSEKGDSTSLLLGYILEALRLDPQAPGIFRQACVDAEIKEGNGLAPVRVTKGEEIFVSLRNANQDPTVFPNPQKVDPTRPLDRYKLFGAGMHSCLGQFFTQAMMPEVMRAVFSLKNIRRAPGESGKLNRFRADLFGSTINYCYVDAKGNVSPFPGSMLIQYDI